MNDQWQELKETITEMRDNDGTGTQQEVCKFLVNLMEILEKQMQEPSDDFISRQLAIDTMAKLEQEDIDTYGCSIPEGFDGERAIEALKQLPSVKQEPKTGHWILDETDNSITCDKCGCLIWANDISNGEAYYCPNCGARMVEPQESEEV